MKTRAFLLSMLAALCLGACSSNNDDWLTGIAPENPEQAETRHSYKPVQLNETQLAINAKLQEFSWKLFKEVYVNRDEGTNLMISPISLAVDLGMFINGLEGETLQEVLKTMGLESFGKEQINDYFKTMMTGIEKADEAAIFKSANSFWYNKNKTANKDFLSVIQNNYNAKTEAVDFADSKTKDVINAWCAENTNNRINKMIEETHETDAFHLMNAVYFRASWKDKFDKYSTKQQPFYYANGVSEMVDMMREYASAVYVETDKYRMSLKPFVDDAFQMMFILPKEGVEMEKVLTDDLSKNIRIQEQVRIIDLVLSVPKFMSEYTEKKLYGYMNNINPSLTFLNEDINIMDNFNEFNSMSAMQKTFFVMDEDGAESAAVTNNTSTTTNVTEVVFMNLDRPFFYAIVESNTQCPLFIGYYGN